MNWQENDLRRKTLTNAPTESHPNMKINDLCQAMAAAAPLKLAEDWDNVGLLLGDREGPARRVMTCLTITPDVVAEAERENVDLIVSHHPFPFQAVKKVTTDSITGELLWRLIRAGVAVYSAHTAFDSAGGGINEQWASALELTAVKPMIPMEEDPALGSGRVGTFNGETTTAGEVLAMAAKFSGSTRPRMAGDASGPVRRIGVACGSGGSFVGAARRAGCDMLITGEATFHACLEAENSGIALGLVGHYASERFAMEELAQRLQAYPLTLKKSANLAASGDLEYQVWASKDEMDVIG